ncbi:MAG: mechanosensitive ion channel domain-containing protein, partial [Pseudomonadota bacterium]
MDNSSFDAAADLASIVLSFATDAIVALVILILGWMVAGWVRRATLRALTKSGKVDQTLRPVIANIVRYAILIFVVIAVLAQFGVQTTSVIAVLGAAGLAVGLALQGTLQNIAAGFMLLLLRPFGVGDYIDAGGVAGTVDEIGLFVTTMTTFDGVYVAVPNSQLWGAAVYNYSRLPTRRIDLTVGIGYGDDIEKAQGLLMDLATNDPRVHKDPEPQVMVKTLGESSVDVNL